MHPHQINIIALKSLLGQSEQAPAEVGQRLQWFIHFAECGSVSETCRLFGIARTTFYRWMKRFDPQDLRSLQDAAWSMPVPHELPVAAEPQSQAQTSADALSPTLAKVFCNEEAAPCPLCRLKSFRWKSLRSAAFVTSIVFNLALASLIVFTAMLEGGQQTSAKATPATILPSEHNETSFLNKLLGIEIANAATGIYRPINYQGKLTNSGGVAIANGNYDMRFRIYGAASGGVPLWSETWSSGTQKVTSTGGLFSIALGTHVAMTGSVNFNSDSLFLQVEFDPGADGTFEEVFTPRRRFASVPYAHNANSLDGLDSTQFIRSDISYTSSGTLTISPRDASKVGIDILSTAGTANVAALKLSTQGANHIVFGTGAANYDTNLYRSAVGTLKTDGNFRATGTISGSVVRADRLLASSGTLVTESGATFDGGTLYVDAAGNRVGVGTTTPKATLDVMGTISGKTLVISGNGSFSGSLVVAKSISGATLEILGTASGADLYATRSISGANIYAATTFGGAGLADCDAAGQTLNWDATTKRFICGVDDSAGSGLDLGTGDARYVKKQGDTMTGALIIDITGGNNATLGLRVLNTISGSIIHAEKTLSSSGNLVVHQFANGTGALINSDAIGSPVLALDGQRSGTAARLAPHILFGYRGYFDTRLYRMTGSVLMTNASLLPESTNMYDLGSDTFRWRDLYLSGGTINMGQSGDEGKIRYNTSTDTFNIDAGANSVPELSILATGSVGIGTTTPKATLDVMGNISGRTLSVSGNGSFTGRLTVRGPLNIGGVTGLAYNAISASTTANHVGMSTDLFVGNSLEVDGNIYADNAIVLQNGELIENSSDGTISFTDGVNNLFTIVDNGTSGRIGIGTLTPTSALEVQGNISGTTLQILGTASGQNLFATRSISGTYLYAASTFGGAGLGSCSNATTSKLLYNSATKQFSCGTDQSGGTGVAGTSSFSGAVLTIGDARYVKKQGDTMTGALTINLTSGSLGLKIIQTASGNIIHAEKTLTSSGTIVAVGSITTRNTLSGKTLVVSGNASVTGSLVVNKNISGATLEILGTASGQNLFATRSISGTNLYAATTFGGAGLADCDTAGSSKLLWSVETKRFSCGTDQSGSSGISMSVADERYVRKAGDTMTGALIINITGGNANTIGLKLYNTLSGAILHAASQLRSSGALLVESGATFDTTTMYIDAVHNRVGIGTTGPQADLEVQGTISGTTLQILGTASGQNLFATRSISGTNLYAATTFGGAGLASCSNGTTSKLLYNSATKQFSCGTDQTGGGGSAPEVGTSSFSGATLRLGDSRYVRKAGDTMTGALVINLTSGTIGLNVLSAMSGNTLTVSKGAVFSGSGITFSSSGQTVFNALNRNVDFSIRSQANNSAFFLDASTSRVGIGTNVLETALEVVGSVSGTTLIATGTGSRPVLFASAPWNAVGIGTSTPGQRLTVSGGTILNVAGGTVKSLSGVNIGTQVNDVAVVGRYAYVAGGNSPNFRIVDISNPLNPRTVSSLHFGYAAQSIVVSGKYAYVGTTTTTNENLRIIDISNPFAPVQVATTSVAGGMVGVQAMAINGKTLYMGKASDFSTAEFVIADITNPLAPKMLSSIDTGLGINSITVQGKYAYVGMDDDFSSGNEFRVIDISSPNNPIDKGGLSLSTPVKSISVSGPYAYVGLSSVSGNDFRIFDISNPSSISTVGGLDLSTDVLSVDIAGRYAYLGLTSASGNDFRVVNISNPASPSSVGGADLSTSAAKVVAAGKYLYVGTSEVVGADFTIYDINGIDAPSASIGTLGVDVLYVGRNATVANSLNVLNSINVGPGGIKSDGMLAISVGSGATISGMTGAVIQNRGFSGTVLALDSWRRNGTGSSKIVPHLLFGYRGTYDTMLYRAGTGTLANSGTLLLRAGTGRTVLKIESGMSSSTDANIIEVFSNADNGQGGPDHNRILRLDAYGSMYADGSFNGGGADYAERFLSSTPNLKPGQAVCLDPLHSNTVKLCDRSGDTNIMGIISTKPAFVGDKYRGSDTDQKSDATTAIVGLIGQLPANAIVENDQPINVGDAVAAASKAGYVRKAKAGESTVGVALSPLASGEGTIDVLITRRNQSDLVEKIENEVTQSIADMHIEDDVLQMVQGAMTAANISGAVGDAVRSQVQSLNLASQVNAILDQRLADGSLELGSNGTLQSDILNAIRSSSGKLAVEDAVAARLGLVRSGTAALTISGDLAVGGGLHVNDNMTVNGTLHAAAIAGPLKLLGMFSPDESFRIGAMGFSGSTVAIGDIAVPGALKVVGDVTVSGLATFVGNVDVQGELIVSDRQAGYAVIPAGLKSVTVSFSTGFVATPVVTASPDQPVPYAVSKATSTGFTIRIAAISHDDVTFSWLALSTYTPTLSQGHSAAGTLIPFHVDAEGHPYSQIDALWNSCILDPNAFDACRGYHQGSLWFAHPDIANANLEILTFTYDATTVPPSLVLPEKYTPVVVESIGSSSSVSSSESSSASSESSAASESSSSSEASTDSSSSSSEESVTPPPTDGGQEESSSSSDSSSSEASTPPTETPPAEGGTTGGEG